MSAVSLPPSELLFDESPVPMAIGDLAGLILRANAAFARILGYEPGALVGQNIDSLRVPEGAAVSMEALGPGGLAELRVERRLERADGRILTGVFLLRRFTELDGTDRVLAAFLDETERREVERRLRYDAFHDRMTGLPNRALFLDRLEQALVRDEAGAVLVIGIDRLRALNETQGHTAGDRVVVDIARRLQAVAVRGTTIARIGGDEFAVLSTTDYDDTTVDIVRAAARASGGTRDRQGPVTASIGVRVLAGLEAPELVVGDALLAMQRAKELGRDRVVVYDPSLRGRASRVADIARALRDALHGRELDVDYQPICRSVDGSLTGFEALVRWRRGPLGLVSPTEFIPVAERRGLIQPLGEQVTQLALAQLAAWRASDPAADPLTMSINLSPAQVHDTAHMRVLRSLVERSGVPPDRVHFEVTESLFVDLTGDAADGLFSLRSLGAKLVLDDFGTGYSSLTHLASLRFDGLKADRTFVQQATEDGRSRTLVRSIAQIARGLDMHSVAEGVETEAQHDLLLEAGFDALQGFFFGRPVPPDGISIEELSKRRSWPGTNRSTMTSF